MKIFRTKDSKSMRPRRRQIALGLTWGLTVALLCILYLYLLHFETLFHFTQPLFERAQYDVDRRIPNLGFPSLASRRGYAYLEGLLNATAAAIEPDPEATARACALYGLKALPRRRRVFDVFTFDNEFAMLEMRMHELADVVQLHIVVEADRTFSGLHKPLRLHEALAGLQQEAVGDFGKWMTPKLVSRLHPIALSSNQFASKASPWDVEHKHRDAFYKGLKDAGAQPDDLVLVTDADEIPRASTVELLASCRWDHGHFPAALLARFNYFSYEWVSPGRSWLGATVVLYGEDMHLQHGGGKTHFEDGSWHCSWCLPTIADVQHKIESYSHTEHNKPQFRDPEHIQAALCNGKDLFNRYPEVTTWSELWNAPFDGSFLRQTSVVGAPQYFIDHMHEPRFSHLLPGHCVRKDYNSYS